MKRMNDPFPPTPEGFHRRVEATLQTLEEKDTEHGKLCGKTVALIAAIVAALLAMTAVAAVIGQSNFKRKLNRESIPEVAGLVEEPHMTAERTDKTDFDFSIDEIIWEGGDLYISYSLSAPENGNYIVAMSNPTLNGERLYYDAKGWTTPKFIDPIADGDPAVLLLGGSHDRTCNELWTFAVDSRLRRKPDNRLGFKAVLYRTELDLKGGSDWTDMLNPPDSLSDGAIGVIERAEYVTERTISMDLDATRLEQALFNDVAEHDYDVDGLHLHIDYFRMTHLGIAVKYTLSVPDTAQDTRDSMATYDAFFEKQWRFGTVDGRELGYSLGGSGGAGLDALEDGSPVYRCSWSDSVFMPLKDVDRIIFAPVVYEDDDEGRQRPPVYDMDRAIVLTPTCKPELIIDMTPEPTLEPGEDISK